MTVPPLQPPPLPADPLDTVRARAAALFETERFADAETALRQLLARSPGNTAALGRLAVVQLRLGRPRDALATADALVAAAPADAWAHQLRSGMLLARRRRLAALAAAREAIRLDPTYVHAYDAAAAALLMLLRPRAAQKMAERRRELAPADPDSYALLAEVARQRERAADVETHARVALAFAPTHPRATELLSWALLAQGQNAAAVDTSLEAVRRAPGADTSAQFARAAQALPRRTALALGGPAVALGATGLAAWLTPPRWFGRVVPGVFCGGMALWVALGIYHTRRHRRRLRPEVRRELRAVTPSAGRQALLVGGVLAWLAAVLFACMWTLVVTLGGPAARPQTALGWAGYAATMIGAGWVTQAGWRWARKEKARTG